MNIEITITIDSKNKRQIQATGLDIEKRDEHRLVGQLLLLSAQDVADALGETFGKLKAN